MLSAILGKKVGMTQVYDEAGKLHPVTVVHAEPCTVLQVKTEETDGYTAVQFGSGDVKAHRAAKPLIGHCAKANVKPQQFIKEVRVNEIPEGVEPGAKMGVEAFEEIQYVDVEGRTKGKGFAGVMKRYNFGGQCASHGVERKHRSPGSISGHGTNLGTGPKLKKGKRMGGHMGDVNMTSRNHRVVGVDKDNNLLLIKGPLPGPNGSTLLIRKSKTAKVKA